MRHTLLSEEMSQEKKSVSRRILSKRYLVATTTDSTNWTIFSVLDLGSARVTGTGQAGRNMPSHSGPKPRAVGTAALVMFIYSTQLTRAPCSDIF